MKWGRILMSACLAAMMVLGSCAAPTATLAEEKVSIEFYYPVQVGGKVAELIEGYAREFEALNPNIKVNPVFSGNYKDTLQKLMVSLQGGTPPQFTILANVTILTLLSMDAIMPLDDLIASDGGDAYINDFYPGFMRNSMYDGHIYSIPFQRSTLLMFYNKDHFREAGLDPEKPPRTWEEMAEYAQKLTKFDAAGNADRWGLLVPSSGAWNFQPFCISNSLNGENIMSDDGKKVFFNTPENVEALAYLKNLADTKASPEGVIDMATTPASFIEGKASMVHVSSGNLANINASVKFDYGIAKLPIAKRDASIAGGGNLYVMKGSSDAQLNAVWKFIRFLTEPERQAQWNVDTGYIATRKSAFETDIMKKYYENIPQAKVAFEQLESCYNELRVFESERVGSALNSAYDAVMTGEKTPEQALADAQAECDKILAPYNK